MYPALTGWSTIVPIAHAAVTEHVAGDRAQTNALRELRFRRLGRSVPESDVRELMAHDRGKLCFVVRYLDGFQAAELVVLKRYINPIRVSVNGVPDKFRNGVHRLSHLRDPLKVVVLHLNLECLRCHRCSAYSIPLEAVA